jgi:DNA polymerase III subunit gamma/tau
MEKFVVSARKYRPATFDTVVGQSHITTTLKNAIRTNHLAQAFLFCGPRGVGKTTCARILAKTINCKNLADNIEPCNECTSCKNFDQSASFNIHELDAASNNSVEDIRNLIDQVRFPPQDGKYKVYIIDEVHMLSQAAFNAFLKTLEEPPSYAIFILATTEKHKILPTILSRCQLFDFNRIQIKDMADHLLSIAKKESITADYQALELIAQKADGGLRDALSMFDLNVTFSAGNALTYAAVLENLHILDYDYYFRMADYIWKSSVTDALLIYDEILKKGFDSHQFVIGLSEHLRQLLVAKDPRTVQLLECSETVQKRYLQQSAEIDSSFLMSALSVINQVDLQFKAAKNQRLHVEIGLMKLTQIRRVLQLSQLPESEQDEKKKLTENQPAETTPLPTNVVATNVVATNVVQEATPKAYVSPPQKKISSLKSTVDLEVDFHAVATKAKEEKVLSTTESLPQIAEQFTPQLLKKAILEFAETIDSESIKLVLKKDYRFENDTVFFDLDNKIQEDHFPSFKQDLATFVRAKIKNYSVQFDAVLTEKERVVTAYTAQEKYNEMAEKNPYLKTLRELLNLDLVY